MTTATHIADGEAERQAAFVAIARLVDDGLEPGLLAERAARIIAEAFGLSAVDLDFHAEFLGERSSASCRGVRPAGGRLSVIDVEVEGRARARLIGEVAHGAEQIGLRAITEMAAIALIGAHLRANLHRRAETDALTGILNRREFEVRLAEACGSLGRSRAPVALVLLDVDHFKRINDLHGHPAGDDVLRRIAGSLRDEMGHQHGVARVGGEEFAVLLPATTEQHAVEVAERLRIAVGAMPVAPSGRVTASAGVAASMTASAAELYANADTALYAAKRAGRDRTRAYSRIERSEMALLEPEPVRTAQVLLLAACASSREGLLPLHNERVAELAADTARELELDVATAMRCRLGGLLHDVGKIAAPIELLGRRSVLSDHERAELRRHVEIGADLVARVADTADCAAAVRHHLEWFDGTGSPDGLTGAEIPLEARIVAAANLFVAITEDRPYRRALAWDDAIAVLETSSGNQLDPQIATATIAALHRRQARIGDALHRRPADDR